MPICRACRATYRAKLHKRERQPTGQTKRCRKCNQIKDLCAFTKDGRSPDGYAPRCADCRREARRLSEPDQRANKSRYMKWKYGITLDQFEEIVASQGGVCASCGNGQNKDGSAFLDMDHCHKTRINRGALCNACNIALGLLKDDPVRIDALAAYRRKWQ